MGVRSVNVKAIVLDLDRTLLRTDKSLSEYTVSVLNKCRQKGIAVMVATARPLRTTLPICNRIKFDAMVVSNGARILCGSQKTEYTIAPDCGTALLKSLQCQEDLRITLETGDCAYSNKPIGEYETILADDLIALVKSESIMKILVHFDREDTLERVKKVLPKELYCTVSGGWLIQIMDRKATKWNGIRAMLEMENISPEEAVYFGDDQDDLEPIRMCAMGVAVSNANEEVKAAADYVCGSNDEDGVARFLEQKLLRT